MCDKISLDIMLWFSISTLHDKRKSKNMGYRKPLGVIYMLIHNGNFFPKAFDRKPTWEKVKWYIGAQQFPYDTDRMLRLDIISSPHTHTQLVGNCKGWSKSCMCVLSSDIRSETKLNKALIWVTSNEKTTHYPFFHHQFVFRSTLLSFFYPFSWCMQHISTSDLHMNQKSSEDFFSF